MALADLIAGKGASTEGGSGQGEGELALGADSEEAPSSGSVAKPKDEDLGLEEDEKGDKKIPLHALTEQRARRRAAEEAKGAAEKERDTYRSEAETLKSRTKLMEELYGKFEKPDEQLREDATVADALWKLRDKPEIKAALALIQQHAGAPKVSDRTEKPAEAAPAADPRVEQLFTERVKDRAESVLEAAKVRTELRGTLRDYVMAQKGITPTKEAVLAAMNEYVIANGWTKEFLRGGGKPRATPLPNPGGLNAGVAAKKPDSASAGAAEKPKNLSSIEQQNRAKFRELMNQRASS